MKDFLYTEEQFEPEQGLLYLILKDLNVGVLESTAVAVQWTTCVPKSRLIGEHLTVASVTQESEKTLKTLPACGKYTKKNYSMPAEFMFLSLFCFILYIQVDDFV